MPTPTRYFAEIAAQHGGIDPEDMEAVQAWYEDTLPILAPEQIEEILEELLASEHLETDSECPTMYPESAPLPRLDQAQQVRLPMLAAGWREFFRRLLSRNASSSGDC